MNGIAPLPADFYLSGFSIPGLAEICLSVNAASEPISPLAEALGIPLPHPRNGASVPMLWRSPLSGSGQGWEEYIAAAAEHPVFAPVARDEIKGLDPLLAEIDDFIDDLRNFRETRRLDPPVELSCGLLHAGHPGTGKTLGARYIATASQAVFVNVTEYPLLDARGPTRADIRAMFESAERYAQREGKPVILFWDEIDKFLSGGSPYKGETIQEISTQLSGWAGRRKGVLLIATTNQSDKIPEDLKGRRLKELKFEAPDRRGIAALLRNYLEKFPHEKGIDYASLTYIMYDRIAPAKIESLAQETWRRAVRIARQQSDDRPRITKQILTEVLLREFLGQPDGRQFTREEERQIALHEVCHAVVGKKLGQKVPVMSMRSTVERLAHAELSAPVTLMTEEIFLAQIASLQAGYAAKRLFGVRLMGYGSDIYTAAHHATRLIEAYALTQSWEGFSVSGLNWGRETTHRSQGAIKVSQRMLEKSEAAVFKLCREQLRRAERILRQFGADRLTRLAKQLMREKVILEEELDRLMAEAERQPPASGKKTSGRVERPRGARRTER